MNSVETTELLQLLLISFIALFVVFFMAMFVRQMRRSDRLQEKLTDIVLHSQFSERRADMEESLLNLGRNFQRDPIEFSEINHLSLRGQRLAEEGSNSFLERMGLSLNEPLKDKQIFVLTPFSSAETETFAVIRSTLLSAGFQVFRGDETKRSDVFSHIIKSMLQSRIIVANINGRNPNVMYELGIAHMMNKPVILVAKLDGDLESIPFDLRAKNIVFYEDNDELENKLTTAVLQLIT